MFQIFKKRTKRIASTLAAGVLLFSQVAVVPLAGATGNDNRNDWPFWCSANYDGGVKFDNPSDATKNGIKADFTPDDKKVDVTSVDSSKTVQLVVVKAGSSGGDDGFGNEIYSTAPFDDLTAPSNKEISHVIVCYNIKDTTVEVVKKLLPAGDPGKFNLKVKNQTHATNVGNNGTTGKIVVSDTEDVVIAETAGTGTMLADYVTSIECRDNGGQGSVVDSGSSSSSSSRGLTIEKEKIDAGDDIVCVITNVRKTGGLTVIKDVINNNGGTKTYADFTFSVAGQEYTFNATTSPDGSRTVDLPTGTNYSVTEPQANSGGYVTTYSQGCTGTIVSGETKVCTITNDDQPGTLIVKKVVVNNNGGTKDVDDFSFSVNGGPSVAFEADGQNNFTVNAGTYNVVETVANGYTVTYDNCANVVVPNGGTATCTITNDDKAAKLTVVKHVVNNNGGTKVASDFTMNVTGTNVSDDSFPGSENGTTVTLSAGAYSVSENSPTGYIGSYSADCTGTIALGEHKTCVVTNDDKVPVLVLVKQVLNLNGGTAEADDWLLKATGPTTISGWGGATSGSNFKAGTYSLSEWFGPSGYSASGWTCVGGSQAGSQITLGLGEAVACTITNYDNPTKITVTKEVVNDNGGTAEPEDFKLWVDGTQVLSGVTNTFDGNEWYYISESDGPDGYKKTSLKCFDTTGQHPVFVGNPFYAKLGRSYSCKIVNDDIAPKLTIIKDSQPNSIQAFDFTIEGKDNQYYKEFKLNDNNTSWPLDNDKTFYLDAGKYVVKEGQTDGWYLDSIYCWGDGDWEKKVDHSKVFVKLNIGEEVTCKFINKKFGEIKGFKFEDVNKNGQKDDNEPKLSGWTITLEKLCLSRDAQQNLEEAETLTDDCEDYTASTVTDENGWYKFEDLKTGLYRVCEVLQTGWVQTAPGTDDGCEKVWLKSGDTDFVKFGNFKLGQLTGIKFNDLNGNGLRDQNEPTLKDWEIVLTKECQAAVRAENVTTIAEEPSCNAQTWTTKTDATGAYSFNNLETGTYTVCEVQKTNWTQTAPKTENGCVEFTIATSGHQEVVDFGNKFKPQVLGESTTKPKKELVKTGASTVQSMLVGLTILSILGAIHFLARRKNYAN